MRNHKSRWTLLSCLLVVSLVALGEAATTQNAAKLPGDVNTNSRIVYHNGPIMGATPDVFVIWYGCWADSNCGTNGDTAAMSILEDILQNLGATPYFAINAGYPNCCGQAPSGGLLYSGSVVDRYSRGVELTASDLQGIVSDQIASNGLPQDPSGIYLVLASADVGSAATGFCVPSALPHHGSTLALGSQFPYAFVGNPVRCPAVEAPQFVARNGRRLPTPNGNFAADAMASTIAHVLSTVITNPFGGGWFDRYGLENADKCQGQFGQTYVTANGAKANFRWGNRDFLIQENWVNDSRGRCAMAP